MRLGKEERLAVDGVLYDGSPGGLQRRFESRVEGIDALLLFGFLKIVFHKSGRISKYYGEILVH